MALQQATLSYEARRKPEEVQWPPQFLDSSDRVLPFGSFHEGETPFHLDLTTATAAAVQRQDVSDEYAAYWQQLVAPDGRPYFFDHVSNTWRFAPPAQLCVLACRTEKEPEDVQSDDKDLQARLAAVLQFSTGKSGVTAGQGWVLVDNPRAGYQCIYCERIFAADSAVEQHIACMAGRGNHPPCREAAWATAAPVAVVPAQALPAQAAARAPAPAPAIVSAEDVERVEREGVAYWFNRNTQATAWSREELVKKNQLFYQGMTEHKTQDGKHWWRWVDAKDPTIKFKSWELKELYDMVNKSGALEVASR